MSYQIPCKLWDTVTYTFQHITFLHLGLYNGRDKILMLGLMLIYVSKWASGALYKTCVTKQAIWLVSNNPWWCHIIFYIKQVRWICALQQLPLGNQVWLGVSVKFWAVGHGCVTVSIKQCMKLVTYCVKLVAVGLNHRTFRLRIIHYTPQKKHVVIYILLC